MTLSPGMIWNAMKAANENRNRVRKRLTVFFRMLITPLD
jgi:hypothetical protein